MITSAQARTKAREAEKKLDWIGASYWYRYTISVYPESAGQLAEYDIENLSRKADSCLYMADLERAGVI
jgi:hypothetical protein